VDNVTHAFVGAAMGECAVPPGAAPRTRVAMMAVGMIAANAPDVDLLYTNIIEEPLGYLLHHRGHSHTLPGLAVIGLLIWSCLRLVPSLRSAVGGAERRWIVLIAAALASHLLMDAANGYGTHLFYPFSSQWVYGDAVFVLEPWFWVLLGTTLALNGGRRARLLIVLLSVALLGAVAAVGVLHPVILVVMLVAASAAALTMRTRDRRSRAAAALIVTAAIFLVMPGVSRVAKARARTLAGLGDRDVVDIVADANPGVPWCWSVLVLQKGNEPPSKTLIARRGSLSLLPRIWPAASCASARLSQRAGPGDVPPTPPIVWHRRWQLDVDALRAVSAGNCRARAWLQFGRVPYLDNGRMLDLRFEAPLGQNFTSMAVDGPVGCPRFLTAWEPPRADVLMDSRQPR
jgi:inner membrane protein